MSNIMQLTSPHTKETLQPGGQSIQPKQRPSFADSQGWLGDLVQGDPLICPSAPHRS